MPASPALRPTPGELGVDSDQTPSPGRTNGAAVRIMFVERLSRWIVFVSGDDQRSDGRIERAEFALEALHRNAGGFDTP